MTDRNALLISVAYHVVPFMALFNIGVLGYLLFSVPLWLYWVFRFSQGEVDISPYPVQYESTAGDYEVKEDIQNYILVPNGGANINDRDIPMSVKPVIPTFFDGIKSIFRFVVVWVLCVFVVGLAVYAVYAMGNALPEPMDSMLKSGDSGPLFGFTYITGILVAVIAHYRAVRGKYTRSRSMPKRVFHGVIYVPLFMIIGGIGGWIIIGMYYSLSLAVVFMTMPAISQ